MVRKFSMLHKETLISYEVIVKEPQYKSFLKRIKKQYKKTFKTKITFNPFYQTLEEIARKRYGDSVDVIPLHIETSSNENQVKKAKCVNPCRDIIYVNPNGAEVIEEVMIVKYPSFYCICKNEDKEFFKKLYNWRRNSSDDSQITFEEKEKIIYELFQVLIIKEIQRCNINDIINRLKKLQILNIESLQPTIQLLEKEKEIGSNNIKYLMTLDKNL